jgi:hypothetical protein
MNKTISLRCFRHLALGTAVAFALGCGADATTDQQPVGDQYLEDTGTPEEDAVLEAQAQSLSADGNKADILGTLCGVVNVVQGLSDAKATEFKIGHTAGTVTSGARTSLLDTYNNSHVKYGSRTWGINLVWQSSEPLNSFDVQKAGGGTVRYGDKVALRFEGGGFVKYGDRRFGINLTWVSSNATDKPYEWEIRGGATGTAVPKNTKVRLFNSAANDNLVYCARPTGINLAWAKDCSDIPTKGRYRTGYCG